MSADVLTLPNGRQVRTLRDLIGWCPDLRPYLTSGGECVCCGYALRFDAETRYEGERPVFYDDVRIAENRARIVFNLTMLCACCRIECVGDERGGRLKVVTAVDPGLDEGITAVSLAVAPPSQYIDTIARDYGLARREAERDAAFRSRLTASEYESAAVLGAMVPTKEAPPVDRAAGVDLAPADVTTTSGDGGDHFGRVAAMARQLDDEDGEP